MKIVYQRNFKLKETSEEVLNYIFTSYPLSDSMFIPIIKEEYRIDEKMEEMGNSNDEMVNGILCSLNKQDYLGTNKHLDDYYSDYYESETDFVNVLLSLDEDGIHHVEAVFYTSREALLA